MPGDPRDVVCTSRGFHLPAYRIPGLMNGRVQRGRDNRRDPGQPHHGHDRPPAEPGERGDGHGGASPPVSLGGDFFLPRPAGFSFVETISRMISPPCSTS